MRIYKRLPYLVMAVCSILYFAPLMRVFTYNGDEGTLITGAARVAEGEVPLRDFFEVMGPGTFYWVAVFFKLLGPTWLATRICLLLTTSIITLLLYFLTRRLDCKLAAVPVIVFVAVSGQRWNRISHHMDSTLFGLLSFAAFVYWIDKRQPFGLFLAGVGAGLTTCFMLPKGSLLLLSFVVIIWILDHTITFGSPFRILLCGYLLVVVSVATLYWLAGGLPDLIYANLIWPLTNYGPTNAVAYGSGFSELYWIFTTSLRTLCPPVGAIAIGSFLCLPFIVVIGLPIVLVVFGARHLWLATHPTAQPRRPCISRLVKVERYSAAAVKKLISRLWLADPATLPYWVAGSALWLSEMHRKDVAHIVFGSPLLIILGFYYCCRLHNKWARQALQLIAISAVVLAALNPLGALAASNKTVTRRGTVYSVQDHVVLEFLTERVKFGEFVFVYPYSPMYYFMSGAQNASRYSLLMYQMNTPEQFRDVVQSLETKKVRYVVWDRSFPRWNWFPAYRPPPPDKQIVEPYLVEHYNLIGGTAAGYQVLERKGSSSLAQTIE